MLKKNKSSISIQYRIPLCGQFDKICIYDICYDKSSDTFVSPSRPASRHEIYYTRYHSVSVP